MFLVPLSSEPVKVDDSDHSAKKSAAFPAPLRDPYSGKPSASSTDHTSVPEASDARGGAGFPVLPDASLRAGLHPSKQNRTAQSAPSQHDPKLVTKPDVLSLTKVEPLVPAPSLTVDAVLALFSPIDMDRLDELLLILKALASELKMHSSTSASLSPWSRCPLLGRKVQSLCDETDALLKKLSSLRAEVEFHQREREGLPSVR